jgi:hypothetical protein
MEEYYKSDRIWLPSSFVEEERARAIKYVDAIPSDRIHIEMVICDDIIEELEEKGNSAWYTYNATYDEREQLIKELWIIKLRQYLIDAKQSITALDEEFNRDHETDEEDEEEDNENDTNMDEDGEMNVDNDPMNGLASQLRNVNM